MLLLLIYIILTLYFENFFDMKVNLFFSEFSISAKRANNTGWHFDKSLDRSTIISPLMDFYVKILDSERSE